MSKESNAAYQRRLRMMLNPKAKSDPVANAAYAAKKRARKIAAQNAKDRRLAIKAAKKLLGKVIRL